MKKITIKFYGTRGSSPSFGDDRRAFGGNTTCLLFDFGGKKIMLDAGSGASEAIPDLNDEETLDLLISHLHLDHISGMVTLIPDFAGRQLNVYGKARSGVSVSDAVDRIMTEPLWPVSPDMFGCARFFDMPSSFTLGGVKVDTMESNHPGGSTLFRFEYGGKCVVTAFDFNHLHGYDEKLAEFARGCDLLIYDGAMSDDEFLIHSTWGHSTASKGAEIANKLGCRLIVTHHSPRATDEELSREEELTQRICENSVFAKDGMTVEI